MNKNYSSVLFFSATALFCLFLGKTNAQSLRYGVQTTLGTSGILTTSIAGAGEIYNLPKSSLSYGLNVTIEKYAPIQRLGWCAEPGFTKRGYRVESIGQTNNFDLYYIPLPVGFFVQPMKNDRLRVILGAEVAGLVKEQLNNKNLAPIVENLHNKIDFSGFVGIQSTIRSKFTIGAKATRAFTPVTSISIVNDKGVDIGIQDWYNYSLNAYIRYHIN